MKAGRCWRWLGAVVALTMAATMNYAGGPAAPTLQGEAAAEELRGRLGVLLNTIRAAAGQDLGEGYFIALEKHFMVEVEDMRGSASAMRQGPNLCRRCTIGWLSRTCWPLCRQLGGGPATHVQA